MFKVWWRTRMKTYPENLEILLFGLYFEMLCISRNQKSHVSFVSLYVVYDSCSSTSLCLVYLYTSGQYLKRCLYQWNKKSLVYLKVVYNLTSMPTQQDMKKPTNTRNMDNWRELNQQFTDTLKMKIYKFYVQF